MQAMDQATRESFISTYKGLLDQLNEKKKAGIKFDFGHELKMYERDHELDTISYFRVRPRLPSVLFATTLGPCGSSRQKPLVCVDAMALVVRGRAPCGHWQVQHRHVYRRVNGRTGTLEKRRTGTLASAAPPCESTAQTSWF